MTTIDTDSLSAKYREAAVQPEARRLLVAQIRGSEQEHDLSAPANCDGLGRIRHFRRATRDRWVANPLPLDPASRSLGVPDGDEIRAQVFQNAVCNWRCWYCYVPFSHLGGDPRHSSWRTADELVALYEALPERPPILDLSGGQPDLVPEWVLWTMDALEARGLSSSVYLWSDDNLSNDYFWQVLDVDQRSRIARCSTYGRVCCFKGVDSSSFAFNTSAHPDLFERQFELFHRLLEVGLDLYAYITLTTPNIENLDSTLVAFMDRLQAIHENLPLRTIPLEVQVFSPVQSRLNDARQRAIQHQYDAIELWKRELSKRFTPSQRQTSISDVPMRGSDVAH